MIAERGFLFLEGLVSVTRDTGVQEDDRGAELAGSAAMQLLYAVAR